MPETDDYNGVAEMTAIGDLLVRGRDSGLEVEMLRSAMLDVADGYGIEEACERAVAAWEGA